MKTLKTWLAEGKHPKAPEQKPHHTYHTKTGHKIHVHIKRDGYGTHAEYYNHSLGGGHVKTTTYLPGHDDFSKDDLEDPHGDKYSISEDLNIVDSIFLAEKAEHVKADGSLSINTGGIVAEMATHAHLINWKHKHAGTHGSEEHLQEVKPIHDEIHRITQGANPDHVQLRIDHGKAAARGIVRDVRRSHGKDAKIVNVGHTSKLGDIPKFTRGHHNDTQKNTADTAIEISGSKHTSTANSDGTHFEGHSLKSSKTKQQITAKNPGANMGGLIDTPTRALNAHQVGVDHLNKIVNKMGHKEGTTGKHRGDILKQHIIDHKKSLADPSTYRHDSPMEKQANDLNRKGIANQNHELHEHLHHLMSTNQHHVIGKMLNNHLTPDTSMPNKKVRMSGDIGKNNTHATVEENSEHPIKDIFRNKDSKYHVEKNANGSNVRISYVHPETGEKHHLATYAAKPKASAFKATNMGWNVLPGNFH